MLCEQKFFYIHTSEVYYNSLTKFYIYRILFKRKKILKKTAAVSATHNTLYSLPSISCTDYTFFKCLPKVDSIKKMICISKESEFFFFEDLPTLGCTYASAEIAENVIYCVVL